MGRFGRFSWLSTAFALAATAASGATLVSNMANTTNANASPQSNFWMAQKFTTNAAPWIVTQMQFRGARNAAQTLAVSLYSDSAGLPGSALGTFDATGVTTSAGPQTLNANLPINLAASTSYWIVLAPSTIDTALWTRETDLTNTGPGSIPNAKATSNNGGASWSAFVDATINLMIQLDGVPPDTTPDAFAFVDQNGVPLSSPITSNAITVTGINSPATVTVSAGSFYSINGGSFVAAAGQVINGDTVRVQHTSSASLATAVDTTLTIGGVSDTFTSTTAAQLTVVAVPTLGSGALALFATVLAVVAAFALRRRSGWRD